MGDADQVGGEGQVHRLGVSGHEEGQEEQAKEDQVEVKVETLNKTKVIHKIFPVKNTVFEKRNYPRCKAQVGQGDEKYVGKKTKLEENS